MAHTVARTVLHSDCTTAINDGAFNDCYRIRNISILDSMTYIGAKAFNKCSRLEKVTLGTDITYIR